MDVPSFGFHNTYRNLEAWLQREEQFKTFPDRGDEYAIIFTMGEWLRFHGLPEEWMQDKSLNKPIGKHLKSLGFNSVVDRCGVKVTRVWWRKRHEEQQLQR
jgi:hypothetical protein